MTTTEFSEGFDTLLDSYRRFKDFDDRELLDSLDFNEYEKSVFLTQAQEQIVIELYTGRTDKSSSFEDTEEFRSYLRNLIETAELTPLSIERKGIVGRDSYFFNLPDDLLFITFEGAIFGKDAECMEGEYASVVPATQDELHRVVGNPFRGPGSRRALRLDLANGFVEIVSKYSIQKYIVRYLRRPRPIVLFTSSQVENTGASIDGYKDITECELEPALHRTILDRAVVLALHSKSLYMGSKD